MSQGYKLRFDQMKENNPAQPDAPSQENEAAFYPNEGSIRELCLVFKDGTMDCIPYSYIMYKKFRISHDKTSIIIELPSKVITLSGYGLSPLILAISRQIPRMVYEIDERYADQSDNVVTDIHVEETNKG